MDDISEAKNLLNGGSSGSLSAPKPTPIGGNLPPGGGGKPASKSLPSGAGAESPANNPAMADPSQPGSTPQGPGMAGAPKSKFDKDTGGVPQIKIKPLKHPDDHKHDDKCIATGTTVVTAEFCLENASRVLMDIAEQQDDPAWVESHRTLADQWMQMAQMLLQFRIDAQQNAGEIELKQQQLGQQDELHKQSLAQNDQTHKQGMQHADDQHKQSMQQADIAHQQGLVQKDEQHKIGLDQQTKQNDFKLKAAGDQRKLRLQTQSQAAKQKFSAKPSTPTRKPQTK